MGPQRYVVFVVCALFAACEPSLVCKDGKCLFEEPTAKRDMAPLPDSTIPPPTDMSSPPCKVAMTAGLQGQFLYCVDFSKITADLANWPMTWEVSCSAGAKWTIDSSKGVLEAQQLKSSRWCELGVPFNPEMSKRITFAVQHRLALPETFKAFIYWGKNSNDSAQLYQAGSLNNLSSPKVFTVTIDRSDFGQPSAFNYLLRVTGAGLMEQSSGWQIESIAVMASP